MSTHLDQVYFVIDSLNQQDLLKVKKYLNLAIKTEQQRRIANDIIFNLTPIIGDCDDEEINDAIYIHHLDVLETVNRIDNKIMSKEIPYRIKVSAYDIGHFDGIGTADDEDQSACIQFIGYKIDSDYIESLKLTSRQIPDQSEWSYNGCGELAYATTTIDVYLYYRPNNINQLCQIKLRQYWFVKDDGSMIKFTITNGHLSDDLQIIGISDLQGLDGQCIIEVS